MIKLIVYKCKNSIVYLCNQQHLEMQIETLKTLFKEHKEESLFNRYITLENIEPLLNNLALKCQVLEIGKSVLHKNIYSISIGSGEKKVLMWSQMHGNESTTTKAVFDLLNFLISANDEVQAILKTCTIQIIPILNPDGAKAYTRLNANDVDLNRDAQNLTQPESVVLNECFKRFNPDFCYNLHGQRTIFSAGKANKSATVSFLAPAQDANGSITPNRKRAMELISVMNNNLQQQIPDQVGVYDDSFNINCVGDTFQSHNVPTMLFEAGHFKDDYAREITREYIFQSLLISLKYIAENAVSGDLYASYLDIPENQKLFYDIIIRKARVEGISWFVDIAIQYEERLVLDKIEFIPKVEKLTETNAFYAHKEIKANGAFVYTVENEAVFEGYQNDVVIMNDEELSLKLTKD